MSPEFRDRRQGVLRLVPREPAASADARTSAATPARGERATPVDDASLVAAARAGDARAAGPLCDRLWPTVDRTIRRLLGRRDVDREDVAQLAFMEIVRAVGRYRGDSSLDTWAQTVTSHVVWKHLRRRRLERRIFSDLIDADGQDVPLASFGAAVVHGERRSATRQLLARIGEHLDQMNEGRAWTFVLHDVLGYDLREVAQMIGASTAATQSRLVRGRRDLHDRVAADPELVELLARNERDAPAAGPWREGES